MEAAVKKGALVFHRFCPFVLKSFKMICGCANIS
jgi:hypothetical protein